MKAKVHSRCFAIKAIDDYIAKAGLGQNFEKPLEITIKPYKKRRTSEQNAFMHVLWREVAVHTGRDEDEIKAIFKMKYGPKEPVKIGDEYYPMLKSTLDYDWDECSSMIDLIYVQGADWGVEFKER